MTREGFKELRIVGDFPQEGTLSGDAELEAKNQSLASVMKKCTLGREHPTEGAHAQQRHLIDEEKHTVENNNLAEGFRVEEDQPLEQRQTDMPLKDEPQLGWSDNDDSWNCVEADEPSGWDWPTVSASPIESIASPSASSTGWGLQVGETEPPPFVDVGYFDQEIVILGSGLSVRVAYTAKGVEDWIEQYSPEDRLFGVDIEWRPNQFKGQDNKAALFQIAGKHGCLIVQLLYIDHIPNALRELLGDPNAKLAGVAVKADCRKLLHDYGLKCRGEVDLGLLAADVLNRRDLKRAGLATLCELVLGIPFKKVKSLTVSNWAVEGLSLQQITYAASDACIAYSLLVTLDAKSKERLTARSPRSASPKEK